MQKICTKCGETKTLLDFHKDKSTKDGYTYQCKACVCERSRKHYRNNPEKGRENSRKRRERLPTVNRQSHLSKYGMTLSDYDTMLEQQKGKCAICEDYVQGNLSVDHCHVTGEVRGLLCTRCNSMLGYARDNINNLLSGVKYLTKFEKG